MKLWLYGIGLALGMTVASTPGWAADCGDTTGPGGTRVPCAYGDAVTTDTKLKDTDPVVSTDPTDVCSGNGLSVDASDVTLNCNGLTLRGLILSVVTVGIGVGGSGTTVTNCTITGFAFGIFSSGSGFRLQSNNVIGNGAVRVIGPGVLRFGGGIYVFESNGGTVWKNEVGNSPSGILCDGCIDTIMAKNHVFGNAFEGILVGESIGTSITANTVENNGVGVYLYDPGAGNEIVNNHVRKNGGDGILVSFGSNGTPIAHNLVSDNGGNGINIENKANTIVSNFGKRNAGNGLEIDGEDATGNVVTNNEFNRNGEHGICVAPGSTDGGGNTAKLNALSPDVTFSGGC